ncbi:MAG: PEP-CTERM sorting domain-containing protein [Planctomycetales bacterium]
MLKHHISFVTLILTGVLAANSVRADVVILADDFNDNSLDGAKWSVVTSGVPGSASVTETNSRMEFRNRGHLVSQTQFNPISGVRRITGQWTYIAGSGSSNDYLQVLTRSDGVPGGGSGETQNGIMFLAHPTFTGPGGGALQIVKFQGGVGMSLTPEVNMDINVGETFNFRIYDNGHHVSFRFEQVGGDASTGQIRATATQQFATNHLVIHNREFNNGSNTLSYLDNLQVAGPASAVGVGVNQNASITATDLHNGRGAVDAVFGNVTMGGNFTSDYFQAPTLADLEAKIGTPAVNAINFGLPMAAIQGWELGFDGVFDSNASILFHYDESLLGGMESSLRLRHFDGGVWVTPSQTLDMGANTVSVTGVSGFSPFVVSIPEPSTYAMLMLAASGGLLLRRLRRKKAREDSSAAA